MSYKKKEVRLTKDEFSKIERFGKEFIQVKNDLLSGKLKTNGKDECQFGNVLYRPHSIYFDDIESVINVDIWPREYKEFSKNGIAHAIHDGYKTGKWLWDLFGELGFGRGICGFKIIETYENYPPRPNGYEYQMQRSGGTQEELEAYKKHPQYYLLKYARIVKIKMSCNFDSNPIPTVKIYIDFPNTTLVPYEPPRCKAYPDAIGCSMYNLYY